MKCPNCGSQHVIAVSNVNTYSDVKGYGCCKGACGALIFGPIGWLCGLLGMGEGKTSTVTEHLWMCETCGTRFK